MGRNGVWGLTGRFKPNVLGLTGFPCCHLDDSRKPNSCGFNFFWVLNQRI